jgi:hypothetical protein
MALSLAFSLAVGVGIVLALIRPGEHASYMVVPALVFLGATLALRFLLGGGWSDLEYRRIVRDEWVRSNMDRARKTALLAIYIAQVPLVFLVPYLDPTRDNAVVGMALLTMAVGGAAFFGSYLIYVRQNADG